MIFKLRGNEICNANCNIDSLKRGLSLISFLSPSFFFSLFFSLMVQSYPPFVDFSDLLTICSPSILVEVYIVLCVVIYETRLFVSSFVVWIDHSRERRQEDTPRPLIVQDIGSNVAKAELSRCYRKRSILPFSISLLILERTSERASERASPRGHDGYA